MNMMKEAASPNLAHIYAFNWPCSDSEISELNC